MSYLEDNLKNNENIVEFYRPTIKKPILFSIFIIGVLIIYETIIGVGNEDMVTRIVFIFICSMFCIIYLIISLIIGKFTEYGVTNIRVISKTGILSRDVIEMNLESIESIGLKQTIIDRILQTGSIQISGRGIGDVTFKNVDDPVKIRKTIENRN